MKNLTDLLASDERNEDALVDGIEKCKAVGLGDSREVATALEVLKALATQREKEEEERLAWLALKEEKRRKEQEEEAARARQAQAAAAAAAHALAPLGLGRPDPPSEEEIARALLATSSKPEAQPAQSDVFEVEAIVGKMIENGQEVYRVRWRGFKEDDDTWEPGENFADPTLVARYNEALQQQGSQQKPSEAAATAITITELVVKPLWGFVCDPITLLIEQVQADGPVAQKGIHAHHKVVRAKPIHA